MSSDPPSGRSGGKPTLSALGLLLEVAVRTADWAGASVTSAGSPGWAGLLIATDSTSERLDSLTTELGIGPRITAERRRGLVRVDLAEPDEEWSIFAREVEQLNLPVRTILVVPLQLGVAQLGQLSLYHPGDIDLEPQLLARVLRAAHTLTLAILADDPSDPASFDGSPHDYSDQIWLDHAQVHQAAGMVMVQTGGQIETALVLLRTHAYLSKLSLIEVARAVLERSLFFDSDAEPHRRSGTAVRDLNAPGAGDRHSSTERRYEDDA